MGSFRYTAEERHFAEELQKSLRQESAGGLDSTVEVTPLKKPDPNSPQASTDTDFSRRAKLRQLTKRARACGELEKVSRG